LSGAFGDTLLDGIVFCRPLFSTKSPAPSITRNQQGDVSSMLSDFNISIRLLNHQMQKGICEDVEQQGWKHDNIYICNYMYTCIRYVNAQDDHHWHATKWPNPWNTWEVKVFTTVNIFCKPGIFPKKRISQLATFEGKDAGLHDAWSLPGKLEISNVCATENHGRMEVWMGKP
jgi:hypothetical protein